MFRRLALAVVALTLVACTSDCRSACKSGITFYVAEVAGALKRGGSEPATICFDGSCQDVKISRDMVGGTVFLQFDGVGKAIDHDLTVKGTGSFKGEYKGKIVSYVQAPGSGCATCSLATVKIAADGTITPGVPKPPVTTTTFGVAVPTAAVATTTTGG